MQPTITQFDAFEFAAAEPAAEAPQATIEFGKLVQAGLTPTAAARQVGLGRSTVYRELGRTGAACLMCREVHSAARCETAEVATEGLALSGVSLPVGCSVASRFPAGSGFTRNQMA